MWKSILNYEGLYEVSDRGTVRSVDRVITCGRKMRGRTLTASVCDGGHLHVVLSREGIRRTFAVHRLVLEAFQGRCPAGRECAHDDGDPSNNSLENLRWATPKENCEDRDRHGTTSRGVRRPDAKLNEEVVRDIFRRCRGGETHRSVSELYGVSRGLISKVVSGRGWRHVEVHPW
jgi:hypothetical protein